MKQHSTSTMQRVTKARVQLLLDHPFFGTLAMRLQHVEDHNAQFEGHPTACTDGVKVRWHPDFVAQLTDSQLRGVLAHEVMHVANGHTWRRGTRDPKQWNVAADKAINHILREAGLELPPSALYPKAAEVGKAAETIYGKGDSSQNPQGQPQQGSKTPGAGQAQPGSKPGEGQGQGDGQSDGTPDPGGCGGVEDAPAEAGTPQEQEQNWKVAVAQAAAAAKAQGKLPGSLQRLVDEMVNPKVAWETLLRDFVERTARNDYNWSQPNRRYLQQGFVLPSLISEELPEIVVVVDTSGSIGATELAAFGAEVSAVLGAYDTTIRVLYCDSRVAGEEVITRTELPLHLKALGGGGTDFRPAFEHVQRNNLTPACLIYLTDLYGSFPSQAPDYPVLWVSTTDKTAPWGETVRM